MAVFMEIIEDLAVHAGEYHDDIIATRRVVLNRILENAVQCVKKSPTSTTCLTLIPQTVATSLTPSTHIVGLFPLATPLVVLLATQILPPPLTILTHKLPHPPYLQNSPLVLWLLVPRPRAISRSSIKVEYWAIAVTIVELAWIQSLLHELSLK
ncbi:hypothetical protein SADUNF_Sadunf07G0028000 [Salix dunnii]|uniref:Uncharacterized protein n=1 Tax=Salix dunnii TaxID=1413687 RepID=A0A835K134_9ROSI|nr:hypothetical protein SADUNF_Sadunf07G0028000 [Salix dunnii]